MDDPLYSELLSELKAMRGESAKPNVDRLSEVATPEALAGNQGQQQEVIPGTGVETAAEQPANAFQPIDWTTFKRPQTAPDPEPFLDAPHLSKPFVDDIRSAIAGESGRDINPFRLGDTPREVFNNAISSGLLKPDYQPSEDMGALRSYWDQYQLQMRGGTEGPSFLKAAARGAKSAIGPTLGAMAGGGLGSMTSPITGAVGPIGGSLMGSVAGAELQESLFPTTPEEKAQMMFDYGLPETRWGRMLGEFLPQFLTDRPGLSSRIDSAISAGIASGGNLAKAAADYFGGKEINKEALRDQIIFDLTTAILTKPNRIGKSIYDRDYRKEVSALQRRNAIAELAAGGKESAEQAAKAIAEGAALNQGDINLGSGNLSMNAGLIGLQSALERKSSKLMNQRMAAKEGTSAALDKVTELVGETAQNAGEYARMKFDGQNAEMFDAARRLHDSMVAQGEIEGALIFQKASQDIEDIGRAAQDGVISAVEANARAAKRLNDAQSQLAQFAGIQTKETAARSAKITFDTNEALSDEIVNRAYIKARREGGPAAATFENTWKAARRVAAQKRAPAQKVKGKGLHPDIADILEVYAPQKNGNFKTRSFESLRQQLIVINTALRAEQKGSQFYGQLSAIREALEKDLKRASEKHALLREANAIYKAHADKYDNGLSGTAKRGVTSEFLDAFLNGSLEDQRQLRAALSDPETAKLSQEAAMDIELYVANKLVDSFGSEPKAKTLQDWRKKNAATSVVEETFPEISAGIDKFIQDIADAEETVTASLSALKSAKDYQADVIQGNAKYQAWAEAEQKERAKTRAKQAKVTYEETARKIENSVATRYLGPDPVTAIKNIFDDRNRDPRREIAALMQAASQDTSGGAIESVRNAIRQYIKNESALFAQVVGKSNFGTSDVAAKDLAVSLRALNEQLEPSSMTRQALDIVLDPREVEALKTVRKQIEVLARKTSLTQGESSTAFNTVQDIVLEQGLSSNVVGILGQLAKGIDPSRRAGVSRAILDTIDMMQKLWKGNLAQRTEELMIDAISDPAVAIEMLRPLKDADKPRVRSFLQTWTFLKNSQKGYSPIPFSPQNTYSEDLSDGSIATDTATGYKIIRTPQKKFRLLSPEGEPLGIYQTFADAESKSLTDRQQRIMKLR